MIDRGLGLFVIGLVFGGGIGFIAAASQGITLDGHDHTDPTHHSGGDQSAHQLMHDQPLEVDATKAPQVVAMTLTPDPKSGHNLHFTTQNFTFAPQAASGAHTVGQGHAHLYVNEQKLGRLYGPWLHIDALPKGDVTVRVTLNANDHRVYSVNGVPVASELRITND